MKERKIVLIALLAVLIVFSVLYFSTRNMEMPKNQAMPWQSFVNEQGNTSVFNLTIGQSDLTDAMRLFGSEVEASLFENEGKEPELEVFFSSTKVGGLSAKVILNLQLDSERIDILGNNIKESMVMPSGTQKTTFNLAAESAMFALKIKSLTFIPSADLSEDTVLDLFGKAGKVELVDEDLSYWYYPVKGLRIILSKEHGEILEFYNTEKL